MSEDAGRTGVANIGMGAVHLLRHGADETGELRKFTVDDRAAKVDIAEHTVERILVRVVGRGTKEFGRRLGPVLGRRDAHGLLALEVVKEGARGHARSLAEVADRGCGKSLAADDIAGRLEKAGSGVTAFGFLFGRSRHGSNIPSARYVRQFRINAASSVRSGRDAAESCRYAPERTTPGLTAEYRQR